MKSADRAPTCEFNPGICLTTEEKARKNLSQGKDNHNKCNVTYRKEIGDSVGIFKFQPDLISNLKPENDYYFTGNIFYARRCRELTAETCSGDYIGGNVLQFISVGKSSFSGLRPRQGSSLTFCLSAIVSKQ